MAEVTYYSVVTDAGAAKIALAVHEGRKINITHMAAGDGNGEYYEPTTAQNSLVNEVWRGKIADYRISDESENLLIVSSVIPAEAGGFTVRELGIFDDEGTMIAVCNTPATGKVRISDGVVHELHLSMEIILTNDNILELVIDPTVFVATKEDVRQLREKLEYLQKRLKNGNVILINQGDKLKYEIGMDEQGTYIMESDENPDAVVLETKTLEDTDTVAVTVDSTTYGVKNASSSLSDDVPEGGVVFSVVE